MTAPKTVPVVIQNQRTALQADPRLMLRFALNTNPIAQEILAEQPEWADLVKKSAYVAALTLKPPRTFNRALIVEQVKSGADIHEVATMIETIRRESDVFNTAASLRIEAQHSFNEELADWIDASAGPICQSLEQRLNDVIRRAQPLVDEIRDVDGPADLVRHPAAVPAYIELTALGDEFESLRHAHKAIVLFDNKQQRIREAPDGGKLVVSWPLSEVLADYSTAWPTYFLRDGIHAGREYDSQAVHAEPAIPPWYTSLDQLTLLYAEWNTTVLVRRITENNWTIWCPTGPQLEQRQRELDALSDAAQADYVKQARAQAKTSEQAEVAAIIARTK